MNQNPIVEQKGVGMNGQGKEGDLVLEKIMIRTDRTGPASHLVSLLKMLFPECEIQIMKHVETPHFRESVDGSQSQF